MPKATVTAIKEWNGGKGANVTLQSNGNTVEACLFTDSPMYKLLAKDIEIDAQFEKREKRNAPGEHQWWLTSVNGTPEKAPKGGGGGGRGGYQQAPKDEAPIAMQVILKAATELVIQEMGMAKDMDKKVCNLDRFSQIANALVDDYVLGYLRIKKAHGGL